MSNLNSRAARQRLDIDLAGPLDQNLGHDKDKGHPYASWRSYAARKPRVFPLQIEGRRPHRQTHPCHSLEVGSAALPRLAGPDVGANAGFI